MKKKESDHHKVLTTVSNDFDVFFSSEDVIEGADSYKTDEPVQLSLLSSLSSVFFSLSPKDSEEKTSKLLQFFDLMPIFNANKNQSGDSSEIYSSNVTINNIDFKINISPAAIKIDNKTKYFLPGTTELKILDGLKRLSSNNEKFLFKRVVVNEEENTSREVFGVQFTMNALSKACSSDGKKRAYSIENIKHSLLILSKTSIEIIAYDNKNGYKTTYIERLVSNLIINEKDRDVESKSTLSSLILHPMIADDISAFNYRLINAEVLNMLKSNNAIMIYKNICVKFKHADEKNKLTIKLSTILSTWLYKDDSYIENKYLSDARKVVINSLDELKKLGQINYRVLRKIKNDGFSEKYVTKRAIDEIYEIEPTKDFINFQIMSNTDSKYRNMKRELYEKGLIDIENVKKLSNEEVREIMNDLDKKIEKK